MDVHNAQSPMPRQLPRFMIGAAFIALGCLLILDNIGIFEWSAWKLWPSVVILLGLLKLIQTDSRDGRRSAA